nr:MAG TPA: hypothetical protein [Caudoviricetes sp.]
MNRQYENIFTRIKHSMLIIKELLFLLVSDFLNLYLMKKMEIIK